MESCPVHVAVKHIHTMRKISRALFSPSHTLSPRIASRHARHLDSPFAGKCKPDLTHFGKQWLDMSRLHLVAILAICVASARSLASVPECAGGIRRPAKKKERQAAC